MTPTYSADSDAVTVAPDGTSTAGPNEVSPTSPISESGKTTVAYVWVKKDLAVPHFASDHFMIAPFSLTGDMNDPALVDLVKQAGINAISHGFDPNVARNADATLEGTVSGLGAEPPVQNKLKKRLISFLENSLKIFT